MYKFPGDSEAVSPGSTLWKSQIFCDRSQNSGYLGGVGWGLLVLTWERHKRTFWDDENVLYLDLGNDHVSIYIGKILPSLSFGFVSFTACRLYFSLEGRTWALESNKWSLNSQLYHLPILWILANYFIYSSLTIFIYKIGSMIVLPEKVMRIQ